MLPAARVIVLERGRGVQGGQRTICLSILGARWQKERRMRKDTMSPCAVLRLSLQAWASEVAVKGEGGGRHQAI